LSLPSTDPEPTEPAADTTPAKAPPHSIGKLFGRAGAPSIVDLGFDAQSEGESEDELRDQTAKDLIGFPGERAPHISFGYEGERWRIRNVVWVVGQSDLGQQLLDHTYRAGYRLSFDTMALAGDRITHGHSIADRAIVLDSRASNEQMVLALAMRLGFCSAGIDGCYFDASMTPPAALLANRMAAAYAHALQLQICFELRSSPTLPAAADKEVYWRLAAKEQPRLSSGFAQSAINDLALQQGAAMATVVREFYAHGALRSRYDAEVVNFFRSLPASSYKDPKAMTGQFDPSAQSFKLKFPAVTYATSHEPKLNLADPANLGAGADVVEAVAALLTTRRNAGVKDKDSWQVKEVQL
jgi:hypothetical protein